MAAGAPAKRRSVQWRGWSPRDKLKGSTAATNITAVSASSEDDGERQPKSRGSSRRHTLEISFEMLGRAIAIGRQKTSRSYGDVGVVIDEEEKEEKEEVGDPTSAAPKDKAATLPAATVSHASAADVTSSETADGRGGGKSGKSRRRRPRRHTLGFGLLGRAVAKGRRWRASHFDNDDRDDISDKLDGEEVSGATPATETDKKETAAESAASGALRYENGRHGKGGKRRRHTLGIGLFGEAFIIGTRETSHFYHDDIDDDVDEVKRLDS